MSEPYTLPQFESFIVRFWQEQESRVWHGRAIHVHSQVTCDFTTLKQVEAFFCRFVEVLPVSNVPDPLLQENSTRSV